MKDRELKKIIRQIKNVCQPDKDWVKDSRDFLLAKVENEWPARPIPVWVRLADYLMPVNLAFKPLAVFSLVAGLFLICSFASVNAAKNTLPGDVLYSVKITAENIKYNLTFSPAEKVRVAMMRVETRMTELKIIVGQEDGEKQAKVAQAASQIKAGLNIVKDKIQNLKQNSESLEVTATAKEIDEKLVVLKNEISQASQNSTEEMTPQLKEVADEAEKTSAVVVAVLGAEKNENTENTENTESTESTMTPVVEGAAIKQTTTSETLANHEQIFNTTSELIIKEEKTPQKPAEFKVGINE